MKDQNLWERIGEELLTLGLILKLPSSPNENLLTIILTSFSICKFMWKLSYNFFSLPHITEKLVHAV